MNLFLHLYRKNANDILLSGRDKNFYANFSAKLLKYSHVAVFCSSTEQFDSHSKNYYMWNKRSLNSSSFLACVFINAIKGN